MALVHGNYTVGTTPGVIASIPNGLGKVQVSIYNNDTNSIFVGDSSITVTAGSNQGLVVPKNVITQFLLTGGDQLYAVSTNGTSTGAVTVLYSGV